MRCRDCACSDVCYYKAFNDVRAVKRRDDVEKVCKSFIHRDTIKVDAVEVKHGHNLIDHDSAFECSVCGWEDWDTLTADTSKYNYCPNCGADMRGDGNG